MEWNLDEEMNLSGSLLIAHPSLLDPNFRKSVILVSLDSNDEGTVGVVINRPLHTTLGEYNTEFACGALKDVPLYAGGPVSNDQMILVAWHWSAENNAFKLYFGISFETAQSMLIEEPNVQIRGFLGYAGWGREQLADERAQNAWMVMPIEQQTMASADHKELWYNLVVGLNPELKFLADFPDDPSLN